VKADAKHFLRVGVIGAGVMGSGIAAHLANAGIHALLLDIVPPNLTDAEKGAREARNRFAMRQSSRSWTSERPMMVRW